MTIRDRQKYAEAAWDWAIFDGCFDRRISPCDVDGIVERRGKFLIMECKPAGGVLSQGQDILLTNLADVPCHTVLVIFGDRDTPQEMIAMGDFARRCPYVRYSTRAPADLALVRRFAHDWYRDAEGKGLAPSAPPTTRFTTPRTSAIVGPVEQAYMERVRAAKNGGGR